MSTDEALMNDEVVVPRKHNDVSVVEAEIGVPTWGKYDFKRSFKAYDVAVCAKVVA